MTDGCYHYTGEGQYGDQEMKSGNAAILSHKQEGRALRLFKGVRGEVEYLGEFETDEKLPFYNTDAPEAGGGPVRSVIVFRLRPLVKTVTGSAVDEVVACTNKVKLVPVEEQYTERAFIEPGREPYEAERQESKLVQAFRQYLGSKGHAVQRLQVLPAGEVKPIFSDLWIAFQSPTFGRAIALTVYSGLIRRIGFACLFQKVFRSSQFEKVKH